MIPTLGILILVEQGIAQVFPTPVFVPSVLPSKPLHLFGSVTASENEGYILLIAIGIAIVLWAIYRYTRFECP